MESSPIGLWDLPVYRFGGELEGEGSMSIKRMQSDLALLAAPAALGRCRALGSPNCQ